MSGVEIIEGQLLHEFVDTLNQTKLPLLESSLSSSENLNEHPIAFNHEDEAFREEVETNIKEDYRKARKTIQSILVNVNEPFITAVQQAVESGDPKMVSALSSLMGTITTSNIKLVELSQKMKDSLFVAADEIAGDGGAAKQEVKEQNNTQINCYFHGSTESLISRVKEEDGA
jgi:hypothetical protein|nr:MAG TPA: Terminase DNA packaging enzyme [Caudoviricetes sp.]